MEQSSLLLVLADTGMIVIGTVQRATHLNTAQFDSIHLSARQASSNKGSSVSNVPLHLVLLEPTANRVSVPIDQLTRVVSNVSKTSVSLGFIDLSAFQMIITSVFLAR